MKKITVEYFELRGTNREIGRQMGELLGKKRMVLHPRRKVPETGITTAMHLYDAHCPGLCEEMRGYADALDVPVERLLYASMTYLRPRCSQVALLSPLTVKEHVTLARSYEFLPRLEDFHLYRTEVDGKYAHLGGSVVEFGRSEGINDQGLAVSQTSCGLPVSNLKEMRPPAIPGLQFWAVVRTLLENCKDVQEAVDWTRKMPIAFNINLLLADRGGHAALIETLDGRFASRAIGRDSKKQYLHSTNHAHFEEMIAHEPLAMHNSRVRYERIQQFVDNTRQIREEDLQSLLLTQYPLGLNCPFYQEVFGTIKSVIMDLNEGRLSICWGGLPENGWKDYDFKKKVGNRREQIRIVGAQAPPGFFLFE